MKAETLLSWNRAYCFLAGLLWAVISGGSFWVLGQLDAMLIQYPDMLDGSILNREMFGYALVFVGSSSVILVLLNWALMFVPRTRYWYYMHLANLGLGLLKCFCLPVAAPLLIAWLKPAIKDLYGA